MVQRCQAGEVAAFEIVYRHFEQPLLSLGLRMLGKQQDAEDALQTTFLKFYRSLRKFQLESKVGTYLFRIMTNACFDQLANRRRSKRDTGRHSENSHSPTDELRLQLEDAIQSLPQRTRACFVMFAVQDIKQSEIAEILGIKIGTVKAHIFEAKTQLRALMADAQNEVRP